jgi:hypothetical protein
LPKLPQVCAPTNVVTLANFRPTACSSMAPSSSTGAKPSSVVPPRKLPAMAAAVSATGNSSGALDTAKVVADVVRLVRGRGRRSKSLPPWLRSRLHQLRDSDDPTGRMLCDWLDHNVQFLDRIWFAGQVPPAGQMVVTSAAIGDAQPEEIVPDSDGQGQGRA